MLNIDQRQQTRNLIWAKTGQTNIAAKCQVQVGNGLTDRVDVKEANGRTQDGSEHAVVQELRTPDQHVEQEEVPQESENDGG